MKSSTFIVVGIIISVVVLVFAPMHIRQELGWIDAISGSQKSQTLWRIGGASQPIVLDSLLGHRLKELGLTWEPDWRNTKGTYIDAFGRSVGSGHGAAPEIYTLALNTELQRAYLDNATDSDIRELFRVMSSGTTTEKEAKLETICSRALEELGRKRRRK